LLDEQENVSTCSPMEVALSAGRRSATD